MTAISLLKVLVLLAYYNVFVLTFFCAHKETNTHLTFPFAMRGSDLVTATILPTQKFLTPSACSRR